MAHTTGLATLPYVSITQSGTTRRVPVQVRQDKDGNIVGAVPVGKQPKTAFPQPIAIANPEAGVYRRNYDIDEAFLADWSAGLSVDKYPPSVGPSGASYGELDTRSGNYLTPPRLPTSLGSPANAAAFKRFLNPGYASATILTWAIGSAAYRYAGGTTWTAIATGGNDLSWFDAAEGLSRVWAVGANGIAYGVYRTADGINWDVMSRGAMTTPYLVTTFDDKVCALDQNNGLVTLYTSADLVSAAAASGTWVAGNSFREGGNEGLMRLFTWMYPQDRGKATLWCLTTARLLYYDYYAATPTWQEFFRFRSTYETTSVSNICDAYIWPVDGNLYTCSSYDEHITQFTGNAVNRMKLNRHGGLPTAQRLAPAQLGGDRDFVYVFCGQTATDANAAGAVIALAPGGAHHHVYRPTTAGDMVFGGGVGKDVVWVARASTGPTMTILQLENSDPTVAPHQRSTNATYDSTAKSLVSGWLHCNLLNVPKRALYFEADVLKADGTPGMETGCTVKIEYQGRTSASWTDARVSGVISSANDSAFPVVLPIAGGFAFKELRVRVTLQRGSTSTQFPNVAAIKVGYRPQPKQRYSYTFRLDLRDAAPHFQNPDRKFAGYSAAQLRSFVLGLGDNDPQDALVSLAYGGEGNSLAPRYTSVSQAEVQTQWQDSVDVGDGICLLIASDISAPSSG